MPILINEEYIEEYIEYVQNTRLYRLERKAGNYWKPGVTLKVLNWLNFIKFKVLLYTNGNRRIVQEFCREQV
jgi:hypothetical protein